MWYNKKKQEKEENTMAFGKSTKGAQQEAQVTQEPIYLKLGAGERIIRILDQEETDYWRYWIDNLDGKRISRSIAVARGGPIAEYMASLPEGHDDFRKVQRRCLINVLDRTPVKKTSKGIAVYADAKGNYPSSANEENISGSPVVPNNKVLVLEFGNQLLESFLMLHENVKDRNTFESLPIWRFDVKIMTRGERLETKRIVLPAEDQNPLPDELYALPKYDLKEFIRPMPVEFQARLLAGEEYADLMKELGWDKRPVPVLPQF